MIDLPSHIAAEEAHTATLAADPGWRDYIAEKARRMAKWMPALYGRLPQIVAQTPVTPPTKEKPHAV